MILLFWGLYLFCGFDLHFAAFVSACLLGFGLGVCVMCSLLLLWLDVWLLFCLWFVFPFIYLNFLFVGFDGMRNWFGAIGFALLFICTFLGLSLGVLLGFACFELFFVRLIGILDLCLRGREVWSVLICLLVGVVMLCCLFPFTFVYFEHVSFCWWLFGLAWLWCCLLLLICSACCFCLL